MEPVRAQTPLSSPWNQTPGAGPPALPPNGWYISRWERVPHCTDQAMKPTGALFSLSVHYLDVLLMYSFYYE